MANLRIAMIAPPWLKMPPDGYGAIEAIVDHLTIQLQSLGVTVELFGTGDSSTPADKLHWYYEDGQYRHISKPLYEAVTLPITQILFGLKTIRADGHFDLIHDHNGFVGPAIMSYLDAREFPPVLHTLHGPFSTDEMVANGMPDNRPTYMQFQQTGRLFFNGISKAQLKAAPRQLRPLLVDIVYNGVNLDEFPYSGKTEKDDYFITLARFTRDKGQALAARLCDELGARLLMAGIVNGIGTVRQLLVELADSNSVHRNNVDFIYFRDQVLPWLTPRQIEFIGEVKGEAKRRFIGRSRALLFPIDWDEPFGLAVIEALACGTPVIAMRRGAMPEIIQHGVNGFLARNEFEFKRYMQRIGEIDPAACRKSVTERFSTQVMAKSYLERYRQIIAATKT